MRSIIRTMGFLVKEIREVIRQPSLIVVLILGPFLILFLFGIGHSPTQPPLKTILVVPKNVALPVPPEQYPQLFGPAFKLVETTDDTNAAAQRLKSGDVDLVVVIPADFNERLAAGQQATVAVLYDQIDPVTTNYIRFVASAQVSDMNRQLLEAAVRQSTEPGGELSQFGATVNQELGAIDRDLAAGNTASAKQRIDRLDTQAATLQARLEAISQFLAPAAQGGEQEAAAVRLRAAQEALGNFRRDLAALRQDIDGNPERVPQDMAQARVDAAAVNATAAGLGQVPAKVIASPLNSETRNLAPIQPDFVAFYAPAVLALLLQHIAVTFGALSIVRERLYGATELFRVAPVGALQMLVGKYLAYLLMGLVITAALTALLVTELRVPFTGSYDYFAEVIVALILASLGLGFLISLVSGSERQAVQLSMLTLIASVFFSGFFLPLNTFTWPVRGVAYLLPVTYGIQTLQDVMLRGRSDNYLFLGALFALSVVLFVVSAILLRRELGRAQGSQEAVAD